VNYLRQEFHSLRRFVKRISPTTTIMFLVSMQLGFLYVCGGISFPLLQALQCCGAGNLGNGGVWGKKALVVLSCQCDCQPGGLTLRW
jgi:hypothetical protein